MTSRYFRPSSFRQRSEPRPFHPGGPRPARKLLAAAGLLVLLLAMAVAPSALGRTRATRHGSCKSSAHARHASHAARCVRHRKKGSGHTKGSSHKTATKPVSSKTAVRVPLRCKDGNLPVREAPGEFSCDDESSPSCPDGSEPLLSTDGTALTCPAASGEAKQENPQAEACEADGEEESAACALSEEEES